MIIENRLPLFEILDVLRKDQDSYLWNKHIKDWTDLDWEIFKELQYGLD